MRKTLTVALAALTFAGGALSAGAASARDHGRYNYNGGYYGGYDGGRYYHRDHHNNDALVAGIAGLAIGAALASSASSHRSYYDDRYYGRGYYDRPRYYGGYYAQPRYYGGYGGYYEPRRYGYGYGYGGRCRTNTYWDPYYDTYVRRTTCW